MLGLIYCAARDLLNRLSGFNKYRDNGVLGTGMSFPATARGQLSDGKKYWS